MDWFKYDPYWLHSLEGKDRDEVVFWLQDHQVDPDICAGFELKFDSNHKIAVVRCKMYRTERTAMGLRPVLDRETMEPIYDEECVFWPKWTPHALRVTRHTVPPIGE